VVPCRRLELFSDASVAIDGIKLDAANSRDAVCLTSKAKLGDPRKKACFRSNNGHPNHRIDTKAFVIAIVRC
jgi:hypothetical protein